MTATLVISIVCGLLMMVIMASIFYFLGKLTESGTLDLQNAINGVGEVYLPLSGNRGNIGKVQIKIQGSLRELEALTDDESDLPTGSVIQVVDVINDSILVVKKA